jgi:HAMP domain-containing protein
MATTADRQHYTLQTIFSFFLGLMVVALIGVGVYTFYPSPGEAIQKKLQTLYDQQSVIGPKGGVEATGTAAAEQQALQKQINDLNNQVQRAMEPWSRNTSIILVIFATIVMGISLIRSDQLRVLSNGLLLGGLFTMVYGSGWVIASGTSMARFFVVLFALAVTIALGYLKFVRGGQGATPTVVAAGALPVGSAEIGDLAGRVTALEDRLAAAASAFAPTRDVSDKDTR